MCSCGCFVWHAEGCFGGRPGWGCHHGMGPGPGGWPGWGFHRRFQTKEERRRRLEEYRDELKKEIEAIEELLKEMAAP